MDFKTSNEETKTGVYLLQDGNEEPFSIRLHLAKDILTIQEQDVICVSGEPFYSSERTVTIRRQTVGGFGLSIKGGAEHKIPVVISKISKEQKAELSGLLFIGDGILQINGINVRSYRHEEVVQVLRNAGEDVTLTVSFLKKTPAFLKLPLCEDCTCVPSDQSSGTSSPLCDSGLHLNYHPNNTVKKINRNFPVNQQVTTWDWTRAEKSYTVYEIMCKVLKDSDLLDKRKHCFSVQTECGEDMFYSVELECELLIWEKAFQMATFLEVERIQCKTYACIVESHLMGLTVDFSMGFVCFDAASKAVLWRYKFSQLKGSSDDGKSKIKFLFQNQDNKAIEAKELEFSNLFAVLHCIHAFFAAKVACLDPMFLESHGAVTTTGGLGVPTLTSVSCNAQTSQIKYST
nr:gamma-1-syntrophin isoform X4 [Oncorhynchus nerka]